MPSTRSSAATKCISEVPGLVKQTSTPPATNVRTRLSAPFIVPPPWFSLSRAAYSPADQPLFTRFVKGLAGQCSYRAEHVVFFNRGSRKCRGHGLVACAIVPVMACRTCDLLKLICEEKDEPGAWIAVCGDGDAGGRPGAGARR